MILGLLLPLPLKSAMALRNQQRMDEKRTEINDRLQLKDIKK